MLGKLSKKIDNNNHSYYCGLSAPSVSSCLCLCVRVKRQKNDFIPRFVVIVQRILCYSFSIYLSSLLFALSVWVKLNASMASVLMPMLVHIHLCTDIRISNTHTCTQRQIDMHWIRHDCLYFCEVFLVQYCANCIQNSTMRHTTHTNTKNTGIWNSFIDLLH